MHADAGLRERKKSATRQAISDAALALAIELGAASVTVDDIAAAADVSPRTVFNYFATKEDAILGFDPDRLPEIVARLEARPSDEDPLVALRETMRGSSGDGAATWRTRARLALENPQLQSAYIAGFADLEQELTFAIGRRVGRDPVTDAYPRLLVAVGLAAMRSAVTFAVDQRGADAVSETIDEAFELLAGGLRAPPNPP